MEAALVEIMSNTIIRRLLRLERCAEINRPSFRDLPWLFETMRVSDDDGRLLDAICERGDPLTIRTADEQSALDRFSAEHERAFRLSSEAVDNVRHKISVLSGAV